MNELRLAFADKRSNFGPGNFFQEFSLHVERRGIAYVILHGYESPPEHIGSDVDYGVVEESAENRAAARHSCAYVSAIGF